jgi:release factor glutamine methyltransferase
MNTVAMLLAAGRERLSPLSETAELDAQVLLAKLLGKPRAWLLAHGEDNVPADAEAAWQAAMHKLEGGLPLPYWLGEWEFYGRIFKVNPDVLIPRPETELLVEQAVAWLKSNPGKRRAADVGTGSGIIAISLAIEVADLNVLAVDLSPAALNVAQANARTHAVDARIQFAQGDLLNGVSGAFDLICSNLPYVPSERLANLRVSKQEPMLALDGGSGDGFDLVRKLATQAAGLLAPGGLFLAEIDVSQEQIASQLGEQTWSHAQTQVLPDLTGRPRLLRVQT